MDSFLNLVLAFCIFVMSGIAGLDDGFGKVLTYMGMGQDLQIFVLLLTGLVLLVVAVRNLGGVVGWILLLLLALLILHRLEVNGLVPDALLPASLRAAMGA